VTAQAHPAVLSLGSNLGDRLAMLQGAVDQLAEVMRVVAVSPVFETDPVGGPQQSDFLNAVALVETRMSALELLTVAQAVEARHGRVREQRWGPRSLDVDIIAIGRDTVERPELVVPHPRAAQRAFVLVPWLALDADAELPGAGRVRDLVSRLGTAGVRPRPDLALSLPSASRT
jgi:2-amino-4-hydroxy-6-hydroxymethyldihydropteridine diphosphokinase